MRSTSCSSSVWVFRCETFLRYILVWLGWTNKCAGGGSLGCLGDNQRSSTTELFVDDHSASSTTELFVDTELRSENIVDGAGEGGPSDKRVMKVVKVVVSASDGASGGGPSDNVWRVTTPPLSDRATDKVRRRCNVLEGGGDHHLHHGMSFGAGGSFANRRRRRR